MGIEIKAFGATSDGVAVELYRCTNRNGLALELTNFGAIVVAVETPDRDGKLANVNLGFENLDGYLQRHPYFGATVGRYGNRIAFGRFSLEGETFQLATNDPPHHLHGGERGFDRAVWTAETLDDETGVRFRHTSADGDEGFPGELEVAATYRLDDDNQLHIEFEATTNKPTHVNLTNHCYWNLAGAGSGLVLDHRLQVNGDRYIAVNEGLIRTGEMPSVADTPMDFRAIKSIGQDLQKIEADPIGYDHCYVLNGDADDAGLRLAAIAEDPRSGRTMAVRTNQPGVQLYTGNFLNGEPDCGGFRQHSAFCLEAQHYPDTPNQPSFPTTVLRPDETYRHVTLHEFGVSSR